MPDAAYQVTIRGLSADLVGQAATRPATRNPFLKVRTTPQHHHSPILRGGRARPPLSDAQRRATQGSPCHSLWHGAEF